MILFTDGGSTKCDWLLLDHKGEVVLKTRTQGLNPTVISSEEIQKRIEENSELKEFFQLVETLDFYGAGCGTITPRNILKDVLSSLFSKGKVKVQEDLAAAVYAVTEAPGIVCILGTGSNSCYFDGNQIHAPIPSLGYSIMDEASGNYFGKELLRDYFYRKMPQDTAGRFEAAYNLKADDIKVNIYQKPNPNAYLASFAQFIFTEEITDSYCVSVVEKGIKEFITCRIQTFPEASNVPIHFIGSIAHFSSPIIERCLKAEGYQLGNIVRRPMDGLVAYYQRKIKE
ncbi:N-acetylglucosamine kinase [Rasiella rasia]|uniref:N-acetylglucosamine kinase n=1 Tax=Rasiella rasia TaxID=2744027 RepID=A0A6G6GJS9_9FLAO|nr:N-acetylglucosamine kinase [Rasiella rasia]QIE58846.1 N-acetylglucosamine kinase [Rasiella rasia]